MNLLTKKLGIQVSSVLATKKRNSYKKNNTDDVMQENEKRKSAFQPSVAVTEDVPLVFIQYKYSIKYCENHFQCARNKWK